MSLTIRGEAGKALDASSRTPALLKIRDLALRFEALADDSLTWTARTQDLLATMTILPDEEQTVSLFNGTTRIFHGHVSSPRDIPYGTRVTVLGPWWWLRRTDLTSIVDGTERPTLELPQGTVKAGLETVLNRAIAKGCPIRIGTIDTTLTIPLQVFSEKTFADSVADLCKWIPDGVPWWDYSSGLPAFNLTRRDNAADTTYIIARTPVAAAVGQVTDFEVSPQTELVAARVELTYQTGSGASATPAVQAAGTAAAGRTQVVAISGPERAETPPSDFSDRVPVFRATTSAVVALTHAIRGLQRLVFDWPTADVEVGSITDPFTLAANKAKILSGRTEFATWQDGVGNFSSIATAIPAGKTAVLLGLDGNQSPPEWMVQDNGAQAWSVGDCWIHDGNAVGSTFNFNRRMAIFDTLRPSLIFYSSTNPPSGTANSSNAFLVRQSYEGSELDLPVWLLDTADVPASLHSGTTVAGTSATQIVLAAGASATTDFYTGHPIFWVKDGVRHGAFISAYNGTTKVATLHTSQQTEHAPASGMAYEVTGYFQQSASAGAYVEPPAGMAAALLAMQSWTPWQGRLVRKGSSCDGAGGLQRRYNLSGARTALASMGALPRSVSYDFRARTTTIELGSPSRHDDGSLAQRFRQSPQANLAG
jgi:hypothetical protein